MTKYERENWIINIENTASTISSQIGSAIVDRVFRTYGANSAEDLNPADRKRMQEARLFVLGTL